MDVKIVSDLHFSDEVVRKLNRSNFKNIKEMDEYIISKWNKRVSKEDIVWVLGDVGKKEGCRQYVSRLNGHKKLIIGNHDEDMFRDKNGFVDTTSMINFFKECGFEEVYLYPVFYNENVLLSHEPQKIDHSFYINIHGHLHKNKLALADYYNVSADFINLAPTDIKLYTRFANQKKKVRHSFGKEWYYDNYQFA